ncbi:hypothetical protein [Acinetobacter bouvetii]|uniref:Uncharacterized protein n=1 Tax=Acinetobacter bouvetii TaxID=202951 RepID=A0A811GLQ0_9GAMM|nr:hypothetical protein [Acinetobacter bouvetii]CAB1221409.1 hypothetical protein SFB21_2778 [Acinetobacter bouvetii]
MALYCIKKHENFLAYRDQFDDAHAWQISELHLVLSSQWFWTPDKAMAKIFITLREAEVFLIRSDHDFFIDAIIDLYKYD